jgi:hypothetical protein
MSRMLSEGIGPQIGAILTYDSSDLDIGFNYSAWIISLLPCFLLDFYLPTYFQLSRHHWILLQLSLFVFQVGLCLAVDCRGISIVWSANCGYSTYFAYKMRYGSYLYEKKALEMIKLTAIVSLLWCLALWIYYAVTADASTSIAHLCAILLGIVLSYMRAYWIAYSYPGADDGSYDLLPEDKSSDNS